MQKVLILKGLPGSGKTTYALERMKSEPGKWKRINKDSLRQMCDGGDFTRKNENTIVECRDALLKQFLQAGFSVIIDDTNFASKHPKQIELIAQQYMDQAGTMVEIEERLIDTPVDECVARDAKRTGHEQVGEKVIRDMYKRYCEPRLTSLVMSHLGIDEAAGSGPNPPPQVDTTLPSAIICDLDGTLALLNGRYPYDWHLVGSDGINEPVASIIRTLAILHRVIIVSGRDEVCRKETMEWLDKWNIPYKNLIMRRHKDNRPDDDVKLEMYREHVLGKFNVHAVFDDRNKVVAMWRQLGLTCLQVAEGNF